uniref:Uncharacterized protein n=1 Tax=Candidatus Methanogaster sp. ANME-2c ERB4 TaxID=2759911 RepID=A0A7G9Y422_9EURY|nr:hypothetical protein BPAOADCO_00020 [Methanosarcinales archaeon ANME-2c ERB4]
MANGIIPSFQEMYQTVHVNFLQTLILFIRLQTVDIYSLATLTQPRILISKARYFMLVMMYGSSRQTRAVTRSGVGHLED